MKARAGWLAAALLVLLVFGGYELRIDKPLPPALRGGDADGAGGEGGVR